MRSRDKNIRFHQEMGWNVNSTVIARCRRRRHSAELRAEAMDACRLECVSTRRWNWAGNFTHQLTAHDRDHDEYVQHCAVIPH